MFPTCQVNLPMCTITSFWFQCVGKGNNLFPISYLFPHVEPLPGDSDTTYSVSDMSDTLLSICRCVANHHKSLSTMLCESALTNLHIVIWFSEMSEPENNCSY